MALSPLAGKPAPPEMLVNVPSLMTAYFAVQPDVAQAEQRVAFGTSGHRGGPFDGKFNEDHILAIAQAIARKPRVLLLDEPFGALDPGIRAHMHELIRPLWREHAMTILMVTHDLKEGFALGTRLIVLDRWREDPQAQERFGAVVTYDLDLTRGVARGQTPRADVGAQLTTSTRGV